MCSKVTLGNQNEVSGEHDKERYQVLLAIESTYVDLLNIQLHCFTEGEHDATKRT